MEIPPAEKLWQAGILQTSWTWLEAAPVPSTASSPRNRACSVPWDMKFLPDWHSPTLLLAALVLHCLPSSSRARDYFIFTSKHCKDLQQLKWEAGRQRQLLLLFLSTLWGVWRDYENVLFKLGWCYSLVQMSSSLELGMLQQLLGHEVFPGQSQWREKKNKSVRFRNRLCTGATCRPYVPVLCLSAQPMRLPWAFLSTVHRVWAAGVVRGFLPQV